MSDIDIRAAAAPKTDQLNADDLVGSSLTFTVAAVKAGSKEQPIEIHNDKSKPYKPCKGMLRILMLAWGDKGLDWVGKSMTVYNDPTVKWAGVEVGGIRISHVSHIKNSIDTSITMNRKQRKPYRVDPLKIEAPKQKPAYPPEQFNEKVAGMWKAIADGKMTVEQVIEHCTKTGTLTEDQINTIKTPTTTPENF